MDAKKKILINSFIGFLQDELNSDRLSEEKKESLEVAIQCLETTFEVDSNKELDKVDLYSLLPEIPVKPSKTAITDEQKNQAEDHKNRGNNFMKTNEYQSAVDEYSKAIAANPHNAIYYCNRAAAYTRLDQDQKAIEDCNEAVKLDPAYGKAYGRLGVAYSNLNQFDQAIKAYKSALQYEPNNAMYETNLKLAEIRLQTAATDLGGQQFPANLANFMNNPNFINMATQVLNDPNFSSVMSGLLHRGQGGDVNFDALFEAGQTLASRMQQSDGANMFENLRRNLETQGNQNQNGDESNTNKDSSDKPNNENP